MKAQHIKIFTGFDPKEIEEEYDLWRSHPRWQAKPTIESMEFSTTVSGNAVLYSLLVAWSLR